MGTNKCHFHGEIDGCPSWIATGDAEGIVVSVGLQPCAVDVCDFAIGVVFANRQARIAPGPAEGRAKGLIQRAGVGTSIDCYENSMGVRYSNPGNRLLVEYTRMGGTLLMARASK